MLEAQYPTKYPIWPLRVTLKPLQLRPAARSLFKGYARQPYAYIPLQSGLRSAVRSLTSLG
jgi:hypothetical protein